MTFGGEVPVAPLGGVGGALRSEHCEREPPSVSRHYFPESRGVRVAHLRQDTWPREVIDSRRRRSLDAVPANPSFGSARRSGPTRSSFATYIRCLCKYPSFGLKCSEINQWETKWLCLRKAVC